MPGALLGWVERMIDEVQASGNAIAHGVVDPGEFRRLLRKEARARNVHVRTGTAEADRHIVWIFDTDWDWRDGGNDV